MTNSGFVPTVSIEEIQDVRSGHKTEGMEKYAKDVPEVRCFSIIFKDQKKNLDLIAGSERDANHWVSGLGKIIAKSNSMSQRQKLQQFLNNHFNSWIHACLRKADKNKDNKMSFKELKSFMKEVNIQMDDSYARQIFEQCDKSQTNTLEDDEIEVFYKILTERQEIDSIFSDQAEEKQKAMSKDGFQMYLLSVDGNIFNKTHGQVYQDMTQPLSHYYISSSHNTYLMEDQLTGPSSTEAYIRALMKGCRCVELDCWDGPNSEPVIYHGYTFTSKILFSDAIKAIKNYAFKVSPYPVIISLENHCSLDQQEIMARHLHSILQDMLLSDKLKLAKELSDTVIYCKSVQFQGFADPQPHDEMSSFSEGRLLKLAQESGIDLIHHNVQHLSRIYPAGWRTDSSNYNPVEMWNIGCQIVALNFQSRSSEMDIHQGRFQENGGCGYVLKPEFLRDEQSKFNPRSITEGSWYCPKKFQVKLALVRFMVEDFDASTKNDFIGQFTAPFTSLKQGYRHIHLLTKNGDQYPSATLFVHVNIWDNC
ncbi:hypothetical protein Chor_008400 [Crotalus horridus]